MKHFICTGGCKGVSKVAKSCGAEDCIKHGKPLKPCERRNALHYLITKI